MSSTHQSAEQTSRVMIPSDGSPKRKERLRRTSSPTGAPVLRMEVARSTHNPLVFPHLAGCTGKDLDASFQAFITDANQELATLLRDVSRVHPGMRPWTNDEGQNQELLARAIQCAAKQFMLQMQLKNLAIIDELTGLYNRRGFYALAERQLKLACRAGRGMLLFFIDLDGLKKINDLSGHAEGDQSLKRTAQMLNKTFRDSDIVARLGGDEFAVLAVEASGYSEATIRTRLQRYLHAVNARATGPKISLSVGVARFDHRNPASIAELMAQADRAMYEHKFSRADSSSPFTASRSAQPVRQKASINRFVKSCLA